jgi:hypothetical protein
MNKKKLALFFSFALIICRAVAISGCGPQVQLAGLFAKTAVPEVKAYEKFKGYMIEVGKVTAGSFETPSYMPERIKFELVKKLKERALLATPSESEKRLTVRIQTNAPIRPFSQTDYFTEIESHVQVIDLQNKELIAETTLRDYSGSLNYDFAEITHAAEIANFLEVVVR